MKSEKRIRRISAFVATAMFLSSLHITVMAQEMVGLQIDETTVSGNKVMDVGEDTAIEDVKNASEFEVNMESSSKEVISPDSEKILKTEMLPSVSSESGTAVITTNEQFYAAIEDESISTIQVNAKLGGLLDEETGEKPLIINRPLTIQGGIEDPVLNMSYHGIILGADVSFKNIRMEFAGSLLDVIAANGYQLTLDNVVLDSTAGDDWTISVFCGGITGYEVSMTF